MPTLTIKNIPDELLNQLRARAARHHRSIEGEFMALLCEALESPASAAEPLLGANEAPRLRRHGTRRIEEIAAEHRQRWKKPFTRGPLAVDVIRADRDAR